jgi:DNA repair protein RadA/Sms
MVAEMAAPRQRQALGKGRPKSRPLRLSEISADADERLSLPIDEFARVLGGGIVPG